MRRATAVRFEAGLRVQGTRMERAAVRTEHLVAGPWWSELGYELLYWIPFLRRLLADRDEPVTAVSRGGVGGWYGGIADGYVDLLELLDPAAFRAAVQERTTTEGHQKQVRLTAAERAVIAQAAPGAALLHPLVMHRRLRHWWAGRGPVSDLERWCTYARLPDPGPPPPGFPARYVAVKLYRNNCDPHGTLDHDLLTALAATVDVVLLSTGLGLDDHAEAAAVDGVHVLALEPRDNLAVQTRVIAAADAFVATYGGPSYLGPLLGVPTVAIVAGGEHNPRHLEAARLAAKCCDAPELVLADAADGIAPIVSRASAARSPR